MKLFGYICFFHDQILPNTKFTFLLLSQFWKRRCQAVSSFFLNCVNNKKKLVCIWYLLFSHMLIQRKIYTYVFFIHIRLRKCFGPNFGEWGKIGGKKTLLHFVFIFSPQVATARKKCPWISQRAGGTGGHLPPLPTPPTRFWNIR